MSKHNGIIGNPDVAPLYAADVMAREAARPQPVSRAIQYTAERRRRGILTLKGVMGPQRVERITFNSPSLDDAVEHAQELARQYFESSKTPWIIGGRKFTT